jgi:hypothetical protein
MSNPPIGRAVLEEKLMTALVLVFCLQGAPGSCIEHRPLDSLALPACLVRGQEYAQEWLAEHPKWVLSGWRCEHNVPRKQPA